MLFTGSMSAVDKSLVESAQLDGVTVVKEFLHIYMPMIFPTFTTFVVTGMTGIFTNQMGMYTFFGDSGVSQTGFDVFGYYFFRQVKHGNLYADVAKDGLLTYPQLSALAIIVTLIIVPVTLIVRKMMETYGPRTD
jgi:ABC-type sugar transport system permease subunit